MTSVLRFTDDHAGDHELVGGKGANLARLARAGFAVPPGFSISTDAYTMFLSVNGLHRRLEEALSGVEFADPAQLDKACARIRELVIGSPVPATVVEEITAACGELGDEVHVAVRSSGTAEDLADASFAGLHDTYLDVRGADAVLDGAARLMTHLADLRVCR